MINEYFLKVRVRVDCSRKYAPNFEALKLAIEDSINTPDNEVYGIKEIEVSQDKSTIVGIDPKQGWINHSKD